MLENSVEVDKTVTLFDQIVELTLIRGVALAAKSTSTTKYREDYSISTKQYHLESDTYESTKFFLQAANGREYPIGFSEKITLRDGHDVTVIFGALQDGQSFSAIGMVNHTIHERFELPIHDILLRLDVKTKWRHPWIKCSGYMMLASFFVMIFPGVPFKVGLWIFLIGFAGLAFGAYIGDRLIVGRDSRELQVKLKSAVDRLLDQKIEKSVRKGELPTLTTATEFPRIET